MLWHKSYKLPQTLVERLRQLIFLYFYLYLYSYVYSQPEIQNTLEGTWTDFDLALLNI